VAEKRIIKNKRREWERKEKERERMFVLAEK
jgi:hypothetical protein